MISQHTVQMLGVWMVGANVLPKVRVRLAGALDRDANAELLRHEMICNLSFSYVHARAYATQILDNLIILDSERYKGSKGQEGRKARKGDTIERGRK